MKREMHTNSLEVYYETKHKHVSKKQQIIEALNKLGAATMHSIAKYMRVPVHTISGRFGELRDAGKIIESSKTQSKKTIWKLNSEN